MTNRKSKRWRLEWAADEAVPGNVAALDLVAEPGAVTVEARSQNARSLMETIENSTDSRIVS